MKKSSLVFALLILITLYYINGLYNSVFTYSTVDELSLLSNNLFTSTDDELNITPLVLSFNGTEDDISLIIENLDIKIIDQQIIEKRTIYYGYSPRLGATIPYKNSKVNIQLVYHQKKISIGSPLIYDSF